MIFRDLTPEEEREFQAYATANPPPNLEDWELYHPACRDVWCTQGRCPHSDHHEEALSILLSGCVGPGAAMEYFEWQRDQDLPDFRKLLDNPEMVRTSPPEEEQPYDGPISGVSQDNPWQDDGGRG